MQTRLNQTNGHQQHVSIQPGDDVPWFRAVSTASFNFFCCFIQTPGLKKPQNTKNHKSRQTVSTWLPLHASQGCLPVRVGSRTIPVCELINCWSNLTFWRESLIMQTSVFSQNEEEESMLCVLVLIWTRQFMKWLTGANVKSAAATADI